ncbi:MAG: PulJ/GspJ family protein [Pseudobdellovibrionaceae bacterium]
MSLASKMKKLVRNQQGVTLITALLAAGISAIILAGITTMITGVFKSQRTIQAKDAQRELTSSIRQLLTDPLICSASFGGGNPYGTGFSTTKIQDAATPANIKFQAGTNYINNLVTLTGLEVKNYIADNVSVNPNIGKAELSIMVNKVGSVIGSVNIKTTIFLQVTLGAANNINSCYALGIADSLWQMSPINMSDIYYQGGNVGIGVAAPTKSLEVNGEIQANLSGANGIIIKALSSTPNDPGDFIFENNDGSVRARIHSNNQPDGEMHFTTAPSGLPEVTRMVIGPTGNVGIGTTSPYTNPSATSLTVNSSSGQGQVIVAGVSDSGSTYSALYLNDSNINNSQNSWVFAHKNNNGLPDADSLQIVKYAAGGGQVKMTLAPSGNVGIGMTAPSVSLDVAGGIRPGGSAAVTACGMGQANGEGTTRYNYGLHMMEYCNGTTWTVMGGAGAHINCITVGGASQGIWYSDGANPTCPAGYTMNGIQTWGGCSGGVCGSNIICCQ